MKRCFGRLTLLQSTDALKGDFESEGGGEGGGVVEDGDVGDVDERHDGLLLFVCMFVESV